MISSDNVLENLDIFLFHTSLFITINLHNPKLQTKKSMDLELSLWDRRVGH